MKAAKKPCLFLVIVLIFGSCGGDDESSSDILGGEELSDLPEDTGGTHVARVLGSTSAEYGYYIYLPGGYEETNSKYPLLIFLHGKSERGDGSSNPDVLDKVLRNGPPKLIENGDWGPTYPMIVASPQYHGTTGNPDNWGAGYPDNLGNYIKYLIDEYQVNEKRIYLTGLSHGGNGVYDYLTQVDDSVSRVAAAVPIAAWGPNGGFSKSQNTPIWVFVGENDTQNANTSKSFIEKYNEQDPAPVYPAKISIYPGAGHDVWTRTYNNEGIGQVADNYDPFETSIYDWMLLYERDDD